MVSEGPFEMDENRLPKSIMAAIFLAVLLLAHASIARSAEKPREFALLVNGGGDPEKNASDFDQGLSAVYRSLAQRGVPKSQIIALSGSGKTEDIRSNEFGKSKTSNTQTLDYDGDGKPDVRGGATESSIEATFAELGKKMKAGDHLTLVLTGPSQKEFISGRTRLRLWGRDIDAKELARLIRKLPGGVKTTVVTDVAFGGDFVEHSSDRVCVFAAYDGKTVGTKSDQYLVKFAKRLSQGGTAADAHRSTGVGGKKTVSEFVWEQIAKIDRENSKREGSEVCVNCVAEKSLNAKDPAISEKLAESGFRASKNSSLDELIGVVKETPYYTPDLKAWAAVYIEGRSYSSRLAALTARKATYSDRFARRARAPAGARTISAELEGTAFRQEIADLKREEKFLSEDYEALMDELRFVATANPSALAEYQKRKECENHAY